MPIDIDFVAIALLESVGIFFFLLSFAFWRKTRRVSGKIESLQEALKKAGTMGRMIEGRCYSLKWVMNQGHRRLVPASASLMMLDTLLPFIVVPFIFLIFFYVGYALLVPLVGLAIFLDEDAFEAYNYGRAILKVANDKLGEEDQDYMEIAREALGAAVIRFVVVGVIVMVVGPFIPYLLESFCYGLALYANILFQAVRMPSSIFQLFGILAAEVLSGILLLVLPQRAVRTLHRKMKELTQSKTVKSTSGRV